MNNAKRVGIFGGTFNPPHIGHYMLAKEVKKSFNLDKIFFVPAYLPPHKENDNILDAVHREEMTKLLIQGDTDFILSDFEISKKGLSYSIDTIRYFKTEFPDKEFFFIIGSDAFYYVDTWKDYEKITELVKFIVFERKDFGKEKFHHKHPDIHNFEWVSMKLIDIAATDIRAEIKNGVNAKEEVGEVVWNYIEKEGLYK